MQVVGVDFGTSNVRIATWNKDDPGSRPESQLIGRGESTVMPTVIAFRRETEGEISWVVGEDAADLADSPNTLVIPDIKRWALASDPFIRQQLDLRDTKWPDWWDQATRCVKVWDTEAIHVTEIMRRILAEAFDRAEIAGEFKWWAGCPVHAGLDYRSDLTQVLSGLGGSNSIGSVVEEPLLFLALTHKIGNLPTGSYLVYDLGGGSFDCALAQISMGDREGDRDMVVYAADGAPRLGGFDIDDAIAEKLRRSGHIVQMNQLRLAKEQVNPVSGPLVLPGAAGSTLSYSDVVETVDELGVINESLGAVKETYMQGKFVWGRPLDNADVPPVGERIYYNRESGEVRFVQELGWDKIAQDNYLDGIILFGGSTLLGDTYQTTGSMQTRYFREKLAQWFGDDKVYTATELIEGVGEPELVGASLGACYMAEGSYSSIYINRLPVRVTLQNLQTGEQVEYEPFCHFMPQYNRWSFNPFVSKRMEQQAPATRALYPKTYELTVTDPNNVVLERRFIDEDIDPGLINNTLRLVIDRLGRIGVEQESDKSRPKRFLIIEDTPWQTDLQRRARAEILSRQQEYEEQEQSRVHNLLTSNPFGWQSVPG